MEGGPSEAELASIQDLCEALDWQAARTQCEVFLKTYPDSETVWYQWGQILSQLQESGAKAAYQKVLSLNPSHAGAHNNLGVLAEQELDYDNALNHYHQAYASAPDNPYYLRNLTQNYIHLGDRVQAMHYAKETLMAAPDWPPAYALMGTALELFGQYEEAISGYKQALHMDEYQLEAAYRLGQLYQRLRQYKLAQALFQQLIWFQNEHPDVMNRPLMAAAYNMIAFCARERGQMEQAIHAYQQSLNLYPMDSTRVALALLLPPIYQDHEDLSKWRQFFEQGICELETHRAEMGDPIGEVVTTPFYLAYQGQNDLPLLRRIGQFYQHFLPDEIVLSQRLNSDKIRVGFVSDCLYNHSVSDYYAELILGLPQERFEVYVFCTTNMQGDAVTERLRQGVAGFYQVAPQLENLRRAIAQETLDILLYPDIGMDPITYFLAATRLAPVQAALLGHPVTTGLSTMDYFLSSVHQETAEADAHYCETLVRFQHIPAIYKQPEPPIQLKSRHELQLSKLGNIYLCAQTLYKLHPDFDAVLQAILDQDRKAFIVFFHDPDSEMETYLKTRFQTSIPRKTKRIKFLPRVGLSDFFCYLKQASVVLDTLHFGGGSTAYQAFAMGVPVVTWPGEFLRGRTTYALYQQMGIEGAIADSPAEYAIIAVKIATDQAYRDQLVAEIEARREKIFNTRVVIDEMADWIEKNVRTSQSGTL